jgi:hypothetical protein
MTAVKPIEITPYDRALVVQRIAEFLADTTPEHIYDRNSVARENVLPLFFDWTGFMALRPDGHVIFVDEMRPSIVQTQERVRNIALFAGSQRYPEIQALIVVRSPDAIDCPHCGGAGRMSLPTAIVHLPNLGCYCGGLGWLPHDDPGCIAPARK